MDQRESQIANSAIEFARANRKRIARELTDPSIFQPEADPVSVFMAGSPGAGKTEASIELISRFPEWRILRIDPDELREQFPDYTGGNAWLFQRAVARVVDAVLDQAFHRRLSFVLDGTFASYEVARKNVQRSLDEGGGGSRFSMSTRSRCSPGGSSKPARQPRGDVSSRQPLLISISVPGR
jgi:UDP-N-acetylglucosamine kinase